MGAILSAGYSDNKQAIKFRRGQQKLGVLVSLLVPPW